jgi:hypothetical protein
VLGKLNQQQQQQQQEEEGAAPTAASLEDFDYFCFHSP